MSVGLAIIHILLGLYLAAHGLQKATPAWDSAASRARPRTSPARVREGRVPAVLTALLQVGAGILLAIGLTWVAGRDLRLSEVLDNPSGRTDWSSWKV